MVPYPGTRVYQMAKREESGYRLLSENWADYDKYGGRCLELKGISYNELLKWQKKAMFRYYLYNLRILDMLNFVWKKKRGILRLLFYVKRR